MENRVRYLNIIDWVPSNIPLDVVEVDILYKESNSINIYTIKTIKKGASEWTTQGNWGSANWGFLQVDKDLVHANLPSNQLLRPWDNVPIRALAQEITKNR